MGLAGYLTSLKLGFLKLEIGMAILTCLCPQGQCPSDETLGMEGSLLKLTMSRANEIQSRTAAISDYFYITIGFLQTT